MRSKVTHGHTLSAEQAVAELEKLGLYPVVADVPATETDFHWHAFDSVFYILEGELEVTDHESGETYKLIAGDRVEARGSNAHREKHNGFRAAFGLSVDPATLVFPLERPLPVPA